MPGGPEHEPALLVEPRGGHPIVDRQPGPRVDQVELGHRLQRAEQALGYHAHLGAEPSEDAADLLGLAARRNESCADFSPIARRLDVDRLVAGAGAEDGALDLAAVVLGHRQDVVVPHHREIAGIAGCAGPRRDRSMCRSVSWMRSSTWPISRRRAESRRLAVSRTLRPAVEAPLDGRDESRELADALPQPAQPRELVADPVEPAIELADGPEGLARLGQLLGFEDAADLGRAARAGGCRAARRTRDAARRGSPRPSRWSGTGGRGSRRGRRWARGPAPRSSPASRRPARRSGPRTLSNSRSSSVWLSMSARDPTGSSASGAIRFAPGHAPDRHRRRLARFTPDTIDYRKARAAGAMALRSCHNVGMIVIHLVDSLGGRVDRCLRFVSRAGSAAAAAGFSDVASCGSSSRRQASGALPRSFPVICLSDR